MIGELKSLGQDYSESLEAAQMLVTARFSFFAHLCIDFFIFLVFLLELVIVFNGGVVFFIRCDHENRVSAEKCVESIIGGINMEHFFVATQDADIRKKFREVRTFNLL